MIEKWQSSLQTIVADLALFSIKANWPNELPAFKTLSS